MDKKEIARLLNQAQNGDTEAFAAIYDYIAKPAYYIAYKMVRNEQDARDIAQDSIIEFYQCLNKIKKTESFMSYFHRIIYHNSLDFIRGRNKRGEVELEEWEHMMLSSNDKDQPQQHLEQQERRAQLMQAIDALAPERRFLIMMFYYERMSTKEIASVLEIEEAAVKNRLSRARKTLRESLESRASNRSIWMLPVAFGISIRSILIRDAHAVLAQAPNLRILATGSEALSGAQSAMQAMASVATDLAEAAAGNMVRQVALWTAGGIVLASGVYGAAVAAQQVRSQMPEILPGIICSAAQNKGFDLAEVDTIVPFDGQAPKRDSDHQAGEATQEIPDSPAQEQPAPQETAPASPQTEAEKPLTEDRTGVQQAHEILEPPNGPRIHSDQEEASAGDTILVPITALSYPMHDAVTPERILTDTGAVADVAGDATPALAVVGLEAMDVSCPGQYAVFVLIPERPDLSKRAIIITIYE